MRQGRDRAGTGNDGNAGAPRGLVEGPDRANELATVGEVGISNTRRYALFDEVRARALERPGAIRDQVEAGKVLSSDPIPIEYLHRASELRGERLERFATTSAERQANPAFARRKPGETRSEYAA